jgi:hypothetical protein
LSATLSEKFGADIKVIPGNDRTFLNIVKSGASKSGALKALLDSGNIPLSEVMAFGDDNPDLDMLAACELENCDDRLVTEVMHPALTITMDASLQDAASMMIEHHHHRLVVIDPADPDSIPLGIISSFDIVGEMARPDSVWQQH